MATFSSSTSPASLGTSQHEAGLFLLPRELRDEIYRLVLKGHYVIRVESAKSHSSAKATKNSDLSILMVSKAIWHEASDIWLSESTFQFRISYFDLFRELGFITLHDRLTARMKHTQLYVVDSTLWEALNLREAWSEFVNCDPGKVICMKHPGPCACLYTLEISRSFTGFYIHFLGKRVANRKDAAPPWRM